MLDEMRTFVLFADEGSIQKVAERLPLTQPAVTRQIQRLEQALGAELLDRRLKPPGLTPAGVEALERCRRILADYTDMKARAGRAEPDGLLRLGIANGLAEAGLAAIIRNLRDQFPAVSLRVVAAWSDDLIEQLHRGLLDAAIVFSDDGGPDDAEVIGTEQLVVIACSKVLAMKDDGAGALERFSWILSPEPCNARRRLGAAMARRGQRLHVAAEIQDAGLQLALVREGLGLGLMPRRLFTRLKPQGIVAVEMEDPGLALEVRIERSPHLGNLGKAVNALSGAIKSSMFC